MAQNSKMQNFTKNLTNFEFETIFRQPEKKQKYDVIKFYDVIFFEKIEKFKFGQKFEFPAFFGNFPQNLIPVLFIYFIFSLK